MSTTKSYKVDGLTCDHCVASVTEELSDLDGVTGVTVDLVSGGTSTVTVTSDAPLDHVAVDEAISNAGYMLVGH